MRILLCNCLILSVIGNIWPTVVWIRIPCSIIPRITHPLQAMGAVQCTVCMGHLLGLMQLLGLKKPNLQDIVELTRKCSLLSHTYLYEITI